MTDKALGLYIHIPFCEKKCAYCDFYSRALGKDGIKDYIGALIKEIKRWGGEVKNRPIDTIYIGGGTPSLLGEEIIPLLEAVRENFKVSENAEITAEANPESAGNFLKYAKSAGVNRISVGVQSGNDKTLALLGRIHTAKKSAEAVALAKNLGFENISADLMIGLPESDIPSIKSDLDFILSLDTNHISAYILKLEKDTPLYKSACLLPDDDSVAEQYLFMCDYLESRGFLHYEISNFAKEGFLSRHNLKYWQTKEYIGIGPSAHSFLDGKRFYYPRDLGKFISCPETVFDSKGGDKSEKIMLSLRLKSGINLKECYGNIPLELENKISALKNAGYIETSGDNICLTDKGMLVSNSIITELII